MKQKKMVYVLGAAVLVVWGLIIYRIVSSVSGNDGYVVATTSPVIKEAYNDYTTSADTTRLSMNYRDPFSGPGRKDTIVKLNLKPIANHISAPVKAPQNWSFVRYSGFIRNPGSKKLIAMLTINGKNVLLAEGEADSEVKLLKNMKDSVKISFKNQIKFLTMNTAAL